MEFVHKAEKTLEGPLKSLPPLPKDAKEGLAKIWPWLALIAGVMQLVAAWGLYRWANLFNTATSFYRAIGVNYSHGFTAWIWAAIVILVIDAAILLIAFPKLQKRQKSGWDLLLLAGLLNLAYGVVSLFIDGRGGIGSLFWALVGSGIGFYLLFQVREYFGGKQLTSETSASSNKGKEASGDKDSN